MKKQAKNWKPPFGGVINKSNSLSKELKAAWLFNENGGFGTIQDSSGFGNYGTMSNIVQSTTEGWGTGFQGSSLMWDGSDSKIDIPNYWNLNFERDEPFSMACRVYSNETTTQKRIYNIRSVDANTRGYQYRLSNVTNGAAAFFSLTSINTTNDIVVTTATGTIASNTWYDIIFTYHGNSNASGINIYINAIDMPLTTVRNSLTGTIKGTTLPAIGNAGTANSIPFNGKMEYIYVWKRKLNFNEVKEISLRPYGMYINTISSPLYSNTGNQFFMFM